MLEITLEGVPRIDAIGRRLRVLTFRKLNELTDIMEQKVLDNVTGKILQVRSGELASSIHKEVREAGDFYIGQVYVSPETEKAWVLEKGGKGYYTIVPTVKEVLRFIAKGGETVYAKEVFHPPSREFAYMCIAAEEMASVIPGAYEEAIHAMLSGGAFE